MNEDALSSRDHVVSLLEAYEALLTEKQREIMDDYYRYDLSLGEISSSRSISRAGVYDTIKKSVDKLEEFEAKLQLIQKKVDLCKDIEKIEAQKDEEKILEGYRNLGKELTHGI